MRATDWTDMETWSAVLNINPLPVLLGIPDEALNYFVRRDLMGEDVPAKETLWKLPEAVRLVQKQQANGSWKYPGKTDAPRQNYSLLETYRNLRVLVENYDFTCTHPTLQKAAAYVLSCQTAEGDIRGILGNQYMPYYHGAILGLLIKAGFVDDPWIKRGLDWLLVMRQEDGGWIVPTQAVTAKQRTDEFWLGPPVPPRRSLPHAHLATGMALRAFAVHPDYRRRPEVVAAGNALKSRFFQPDKYNDRQAVSYWFKFQFPFWWSNLLTALDTLYQLGFDKNDAPIARGLDWFIAHQEEDGLWPTGYGSGEKVAANRQWVGLAICRLLQRFYPRKPLDQPHELAA